MRSTILQDNPSGGPVALHWPRRAHDYAHRSNGLQRSHDPSRGPWLSVGLIGFIFCVANAAIFTAAISRFLKTEQPYDDLITGALVWTNADKGFDFRVFYVFLAATVLIGTLLHGLCRRLQSTDAMRATLQLGLALALAPGALWLGGRLATNSFGTAPIECGLCSAAVLALFFSLSRQRLCATPEAIGSIVNAALLVFLFAFFGGLGLATVLSRLLHASNSFSVTIGLAGVTCALALVAVILVIVLSSTTEAVEKRMAHIVFGSELLLPLLCAVVIPPAIVENGQRMITQPSVALLVVLSVVAGAGWIDLFRRWILSRPTKVSLSQTLSPLAILPIAIFLAVNHSSFPTFFGDDFHLGEHLLPWQQLWDFGKIPFVDFVPIHPLMDLAVGAANGLYFDGTLANYANSCDILFATAAGLTFFAVSRFAGVSLALCLALAANVWDRLLFVPAMLVVLCHPKLLARRQAWLLCWFLFCPLAAFYNPSVGVALTLATVPIALFQFWKLFFEDRNALLRIAGLFVAMVGLICLIPITRAIAFGFTHFLLDNGRTVVLAHGLEWRADAAQMPSVKGVLAAPFVWELLRFSWVIVMLVAGWVFVSRARNWRTARPETLAISGVTCLFLFFLAGWTLNRIDPLAPSRTGEVSYLAVLYIFPLALFAAGSWRPVWIPLFLLGLGFFRQSTADFVNSGSKPHSRLTMAALLEKPVAAPIVPAECVSIQGASHGLPNLGHIYAPQESLLSLLELKAAISGLLRPGETYLDFTNRQANYFYLGMPAAVSYGAPWVTASTVLQDRTLEEIKLRPPAVVGIGPALTHHTDTAAVRTYKLYRFLVWNYVPIARNGHVFLILPNRGGEAALGRKEQVELLRKTVANENIGRLPVAWGSSWARLESRFSPVQKLKMTEEAPITDGASVVLPINSSNVSGESDFIKFDFWSNLSPRSNMPIEIAWTSEYGSSFARFTAANGTNLVPLGAFPDWLLAQNITDLRIVPVSAPPELKYVVRDVQLLRLKD